MTARTICDVDSPFSLIDGQRGYSYRGHLITDVVWTCTVGHHSRLPRVHAVSFYQLLAL